MKRLKQTTAVISFMGGAYLFGSSMLMGFENAGVQADKFSEEYYQNTEIREYIDVKSEDLTDRSIGRFAGSIVMIGASVAMFESCYQNKLRSETAELVHEIETINKVSREDELVLQGLYREVRNGISLVDIAVENTVNPATQEVILNS